MKYKWILLIIGMILFSGLASAWWHPNSPSNILRYWPFNEPADAIPHNATDLSDFNQTANNTYGDILYKTGILGNAINLTSNATTFDRNYLDAGNVDINLNDSFTLAMWVNVTPEESADKPDIVYYLVSKSAGLVDDGGFVSRLLNDGVEGLFFQALFEDKNLATPERCRASHDTYLNDSEFHRIVVTRDGETETNSMKLYIDNSLVNQSDCNPAYNFTGTSASLRIGSYKDATYASGEIDDIQIWDIAWTSANVNTDWNGGLGIEANATPIGRNLTETISTSYNTTTSETALEGFVINVSYNETFTGISAVLNYNNTDYSTIKILDDGTYAYFTNNVSIPLGASTNTFYWNFTLINTTDTNYQVTQEYTQTVSTILLSNCSAGTTNITFNFTVYDEETLEKINSFDFNGYFEYWNIGEGDERKNISFEYYSTDEVLLCIDPADETLIIDGEITYSTNSETDYVTRNYYFEDHSINNVTQNISLYLLNQSSSTTFILHVKDQSQLNVKDAIVKTQRFYESLGEYKITQMTKTDGNGKGSGFFKTEDVDYRFIIERDGVTELITSKGKVIPEETPYTLVFTIGEAEPKPWADLDDLDGLTFTLTFNNVTNITEFSYTDTSGSFTQARLLVLKKTYNETNIVICNVTSSVSSAILTCDASGYSGTFEAQAFVTRTEEKVVDVVSFIITTAVEIFGNLGLLLGWLIIITAVFSGIWHPLASTWFGVVAIIIVNLTGLITFSLVTIFSIISMAIILTFLIKD